MTKDRDESNKTKTPTKKRHSHGTNKTLDGFLKRQNELMSDLKSELQDSIAEKQQLKCEIIEKNKCIQQLQKSIEQRDNEIDKLNTELSAAKDENTKTLQDFYIFREKFYELETHYDRACHKQNSEIDQLKGFIEEQKSTENQQINELTTALQNFKQQLDERNQTFVQVNLDYSDLMRKSEKMHQDFVRQQKDFENYRIQVEVEKNAYDEKMNQDLSSLRKEIHLKEQQFGHEIEKLKDDLSEKDEIIRQCIKDKEIVEEEKDRRVGELNYKIKQIEKVFGQPTKMVPPMVVIPNTPETSSKQQNSIEEVSILAVTKPQFRRESLETNSDNNSENQYPEVSVRARPKKIPRPSQLNTNAKYQTALKTNAINKKRGYFSNSIPSPPSKRNDAFSVPSSDDDDDIVCPLWRPNNKPDHFVPETETDASESFSKSKRSKK